MLKTPDQMFISNQQTGCEAYVERDPYSRRKAPLSVLIPAFNEESNIEACIRSVAWADDVVVVDSGSRDRTCEIVASLGVRVRQFHYVPGSLKKKNWALQTVDFRHEWVLIRCQTVNL